MGDHDGIFQIRSETSPSADGGGTDKREKAYSRLTFIEISSPAAGRDREKERSARSHAVSVALARQRRRAQKTGDIFRPAVFGQDNRVHASATTTPACLVHGVDSPQKLGSSSIDPFETLSISAERLTTLFQLQSSLRAGEPVFNVNDAVRYHSLWDVFDSGLTDGALTAALGLTMTYAANGWRSNRECVELSTVAMQQVRKSLSRPYCAVSPATVGSVVLLLGHEYRLGERNSAQAHLDGIIILLRLCAEQGITLPPALKRAIYWQDMFSSIFVKTKRVIDYDSFYPDRYDLNLYSPHCQPPTGFATRVAQLGPELVSIAATVAELWRCRWKWFSNEQGNRDLAELGSIQAYLEGRLLTLREMASDDVLISCLIALYLCVFALWTSIWNGALIPRILSTQLLHHLRQWQAHGSTIHDDRLLLWLVQVGKAFAIDADVRDGLEMVWHSHINSGAVGMPSAGPDVEQVLQEFIWSDLFFNPERGWFWERLCE